MELVNRFQVFGVLLRRSRTVLLHYQYKSSYAINTVPRYEEKKEEITDQVEEIRGKYVFRPRLPVVVENDYFASPFQKEYDEICHKNYAWDSEFDSIKTVWERLKPPSQEKVEENVLIIGNPRSLPWAPNEWCAERAFDCYRDRREIVRIHTALKFLDALKTLPFPRVGILTMAHHLQQKILMERTRNLFGLVCQTYYTGDLKKLIESDENSEPIIKYIAEVEKLGAEKRALLNVTEQDIITVAPGVYGSIQDFFRVYPASTYSLSITCCALYQKSILYRVADEKYKLSRKQISMPFEYPFNVPHLVFGNFDYWYSRKNRRFDLHDLHILIFSVLPWYKDVPGTDGKFFSAKYERTSLPSSNLFSRK